MFYSLILSLLMHFLWLFTSSRESYEESTDYTDIFYDEIIHIKLPYPYIFNVTDFFLIFGGNDDVSPSTSIKLQYLYINPSYIEEILVRYGDSIWEILLNVVTLVLPF